MATRWKTSKRSSFVGAAIAIAAASVFSVQVAQGGLMSGGKDPRFEITYQPAGEQTVALSIAMNGMASNIYYVDVCSDNRWRRAAFFAPGWYRTGALVVTEERLTDKMRSQAVAMPESAKVTIPAGRECWLR